MMKFQIYRPGEGWLLGEFRDRGGAQAAARALDEKVFKSKKAYEEAQKAGALHQVREVGK